MDIYVGGMEHGMYVCMYVCMYVHAVRTYTRNIMCMVTCMYMYVHVGPVCTCCESKYVGYGG